ncbi:hypothetical protein GCM10019016_108740 [Streptomyces prasinosporus]|uniref:Uncharacterized protein n=1 Tax=Streptomyces prasinosporus TaxID=68256 RepID=A0ABP6U833_9ACTN
MVSVLPPEPPESSPVLPGPPQADRPAVIAVAAPMALVYLMKARRSTPAALRGDKEPSWRGVMDERGRRDGWFSTKGLARTYPVGNASDV